MTIRASMIRMTPLGEFGEPIDVPISTLADVTFEPDREPNAEDDRVIRSWSDTTLSFEVSFREVNLGVLAILYGSRRPLGYPRPLAINGREYRRRVRRR